MKHDLIVTTSIIILLGVFVLGMMIGYSGDELNATSEEKVNIIEDYQECVNQTDNQSYCLEFVSK